MKGGVLSPEIEAQLNEIDISDNEIDISDNEFGYDEVKHIIKILKRNLEQRKLIRSFLKFGWVNHVFEILEECDDLIEKENYWIVYFNSQEEGLNGRIGGKYGSTFIYPEEAKIIKSKKMKEIWSNSGVKRKWEKPIIHLETQKTYPSMKSACLHFNISSTKLRKYLGENVFFSYI
jgi:hypothetical protein